MRVLVLLALMAIPLVAKADESRDRSLVAQARSAAAEGKLDEAAKLAAQALQADPQDADARYVQQRVAAIQSCNKLLAENADRPDVYDLRGSEYFKLGAIKQSIADFDEAIRRDPARERGHWKRGISYYYAGQYDAGRKQFEAYQTFDDNDVENAVWRFLCMAKQRGVKPAAADILKIKRDRRVPMMEVYDLYRGAAKPQDVLDAVERDDPTPEALNQRRFYAELYLGLYYDAAGNKAEAKKHIDQAVRHKIGHYMWDVAKVHSLRMAGQQKAKP